MVIQREKSQWVAERSDHGDCYSFSLFVRALNLGLVDTSSKERGGSGPDHGSCRTVVLCKLRKGVPCAAPSSNGSSSPSNE